MNRRVEPELLDQLPSTDSRAIRSRRDLQRVNAWMGNARAVAQILKGRRSAEPIRRMVDLGAGDGSFTLRVAKLLNGLLSSVEVILLDRQNLVRADRLEQFAALGWKATPVEMDVFQWLAGDSPEATDVIVANLFLHHFPEASLQRLLRQVANRTSLFASCDPRRNFLALTGARLLWAMGCNEVTRHDGLISVRAGFAGQELSRLWPNDAHWRLHEAKAGLFSHCFVAERAD